MEAPAANPDPQKEPKEDLVALQQINGTIQKIIEMPSIRDDMVRLGKKLATDPDYPSMEVVEEISRALHRTFFR